MTIRGRLSTLLLLAVGAALVLAGSVWASFGAPSVAGGGGRAVATSLPTGSVPTAVVNAGGFVHVQWAESTVQGHAADGYVVKRYDADSGALQVTGVGCQGTIAALECTETTPPGSWRYTVTPVLHSWTGGESTESGAVVVNTASMTLAPTVVGGLDHPLPATLPGSVAGFSNGEKLLFRLDSASGATLDGTVAGSATPPAAAVAADGSGAVTVTLPDDPSLLDGGHTIYAVGDRYGLAGAGVVVDRLPPTVTLSDPGSPLRGTITLSASAGDAASGVASVALQRSTAGGGAWMTIATDTSTPYTASFDTTGVGDGLYDFRAVAIDNGGSQAASTVSSRLVDNTNPSPALSLTVPNGAYLSGSTLYFKSDAAGSFELADAVSDGGSGPASATFPAIGATGWTHAAETIAGASPYTSSVYSWSGGAATPADQSIIAADAVGNTATSTLHFVADTTAPGGGSVDAAGLVGTSTRYSTSTTVSIALAKGSDGGSGVAVTGAQLLREQGTLASSDGQADGTCDYTGQSYAVVATDPSSPYSDTAAKGVASGKCYRYRYVVPDNVGNQVTYTSPDVKVVTAQPNETLGISGATGSTFVSGSTVFTNPQAGRSGSFLVSATASDPLSGLVKVTFPALAGFGAGGGDVASPGPYQTTYSWSGAGATASGAQTVTTTANSSQTQTAAFTVTPDTTAPTTTASGADALWHNTVVTVGLSASDGLGAGVSSVTYQIDGQAPVTTAGASASATITAPADGSNDGVHTVAYYSTDQLGNVEATHSVQVKIDTQAPSASSTFPAAAGSYGNAGWNAGCTSAICGSASDAGSGISTVKVTIQQASSGLYWNTGSTFNVASEASALKTATGTTGWWLAFPQTNFPTDGTYVVRVYTTDALGNTTAVGSPSQQTTFVFDRTAPTPTVTFPASAAFYNDSGWNLSTCGGGTGNVCGTATDATTSVVSDQVSIQQGSTGKYWDSNTSSFSSVSEVKVTALGTTSWSLGLFPASNFPAEGSYTIRSYATDAAGNTSATPSGTTFTIDRTAPTQALALSVPSAAYLSSGNLYFKSDGAGSFKLVDTETDSGSGPVSATFPPIATSGWAHGAETVSGSSPYTSSLYSWSAGASTPADQSISATDAAGNSGSSTLHFVPDTTAPSGGSVDATGLVGVGSRYSNSTTLSIALAKGSDGGAGVAATGAVLKREQGTLSSSDGQANGTCDYTGQSYSTIATDPAGPYTDNAAGGILTGKCYRYQYVVPDNVGNQATYTSGDIKVETASPASLAPVVTLSGATGTTVISGGTVFTNPQAGKSGGFTVQATASDATVGVEKLNFPALTGYSGGGGDVASPGPYQTTYSWSGAGASASGSQTVTATGSSSLTRTGTFTVTPDTTAPTTTPSGNDALWHNTAVTVGLSTSDGAGAGVASVTYQVDSQAPVSVGGSSTSVIVSAPVNGSNDGVHTVAYYSTDAVGNVESTHSVQVKIDSQAPSASSTFPAAAGNYGNAGWNGGCTSAICGSASDAGSGVSTVKLTIQQVSSGLYWNSGSTFNVASEASALKTATGTTGWSLAFPQTNFPTDGTYIVRVYTTDALGNTAAVGSPSQQVTFVFDRTAPAATVTFPASNGKYNASGWNGGCTSAICGTASDATSGVASTQVSIQQASTSKYWDPNTTSFSSVSEVKVTTSGTTTWSLAFPASNFPTDGSYTVRGYAVDGAGNTNATPPGTTFLVDRTGPTQAISTASSNTFLTGSGDAWTVYYNGNTSNGSFALSDTATDTGGAGLSGNDVWAAFNPGGGWTSKAQASCLASGACASGTYAWTGTNPTSGVTTSVTTQDAAGNQDAATLTFVADTQAPSAPTMTAVPAQIKNGQSLSVTSAADNGPSGVKSVTYYYCSGGACTPSTQIGSPATTGPSYALTWSAQPADGTYTVAAKVTDNVGNVSALGATQTITVDNTAPTVTAVALANGGVAKTADAGDTATITYSEKIKASTFCSTWVDNGTTQTLSGVTLNFVNNGTTDALTIASAGCTFHLQQVVAGNHIGATMTVPNSTLAWDPTAKTLTITLGVPSGSVNTNVSPSKPSYTPDGALTDWAGNAISTSTFASGSNSNF